MKTVERSYKEWCKEQFGVLSEGDELTQEEVALCVEKWDEMSDEFEAHRDLRYDAKREECALRNK